MNTNTSTSASSFSSLPKHYLFILSEAITLDEQHEVVQAASKLAEEGYVYLASAHVKTMEDRDNLRFMPLHTDRLPCFGEVSGVLVARDQDLARTAKEVYRDAPVMVFEPGVPFDSVSESRAIERAEDTSAPAWKPRYNTVSELRQAA
ncbi:hypothetical protein DES53_106109 [Roseimicrobium gellanilyticum]|uniref:Uncharacterized protein n=1 Tax=Roseimicrobium gellanilyticum TaxID=748857 RepID=A0A366HKW5_9BACT|nr:hypothetical protein [Roseimicrobium gellanilyticum]RBP42403.1 hypothetical protein DES53_106109 [Roseimicrobium gellanilyticum]